jgi:hypothetical protein
MKPSDILGEFADAGRYADRRLYLVDLLKWAQLQMRRERAHKKQVRAAMRAVADGMRKQ